MKKNKNHIISFRLNDYEFAELLLKISDANGVQMLKPSVFARGSLISAQVRANDSELEKYRVFIAGQVSRQIQQIAGALETANKSDKTDDELLIELVEKIDLIMDEMNALLSPLDARTEWH